jgi:hypothetical protein
MKEKSKEESQLWHQEVGWVRGQQYFTLFLDEGPKPWFAKCKLNRWAVTSICQLWRGHKALAHSLACFNIVPNGICTCQTAAETPDHVFWQCQRFTKERKNLTKGLLKRWNMLPLEVNKILVSMDPSDVTYSEPSSVQSRWGKRSANLHLPPSAKRKVQTTV